MYKYFCRCISLFLTALLTLFPNSLCTAADVDLTNMDVDALIALRASINAELTSRPEASPFRLNPGLYLVGEDIKAGKYYVAAEAPSTYTAQIMTYADKEAYQQDKSSYIDAKYLPIDAPAVFITLEDGNLIDVMEAPLMFSITGFEGDRYFTYTPPEGNYVPAGIYTVGMDIPAGTYQFFAATLNSKNVCIYKNSVNDEDYEVIGLYRIYASETNYKTAILSDGNVLEVKSDIVMRKQPKLSFE